MTKTDETPGSAEGLELFTARALDWPAVREEIVRHAPSAIGVRALRALGPREDAAARDALARAREIQALAAEGESPPLDGGDDPLPALALAARYRRALEGEELLAVARLLRMADGLGPWLAARRAGLPRCEALWAGRPDLSPLRDLLEAALDRRGRVVDDASPLLKRLRREIATLSRQVERTVREMAGRPGLRSALADGHAGQALRRGGRLVLAVRTAQLGRVPGIVHDRSQTGETLFVEPEAVVEKGNRLAACAADQEREAGRVLTELTREVLARREEVEETAARVAELELAVASARYAARVGGRPARLPDEEGAYGGLLLRQARHPLLLEEERKGRIPAVVPLDLRLGVDFEMLVITGPNTGGKTLALKTAGLAALMTRLGLAFPCGEGTTVPLYDGVAADIGDEQEIQQNLSTFSSHLERIRRGLARAGRRTLVLLDELGGGTDPVEGAALSDAILERLLEVGCHTLASTHLGQLKEFAFRHPRVENAHVEFDIETLAPRYRLVIGAPGESRALAIARRLGLPAELVEAAGARMERRSGEAEELMAEMRRVRVDAERLRAEAEDRLRELEGRVRELEEKRDHLERRREQVEAEAQRGLEERLSRARAWVDRGRQILPRLSSLPRHDVEALLAGLEEALGDAQLTDRRRAFLDGLKKGSLVWLPRYKKRCLVTRLWRDKRQLAVRLGKRDLTVDFDDVTFYETL
ncbi:MAG: endonuclease MutS2 [Planctomycetota bacterium]